MNFFQLHEVEAKRERSSQPILEIPRKRTSGLGNAFFCAGRYL